MRFKPEKLLVLILAVRLLTLFIPWLAGALLVPDSIHLSFLNFTQNSWHYWDASHYLYLANNWYTNLGDEANFIVFFPLYPLILKIFAGLNIALGSIFLSIGFFVAGSYYFYELVRIDYPEKIARWAVVAMAIFPTSYFFNAPYTESLFLFVFSVAMYSARKEKWAVSGIFTALCCLTRPFGLLVLPAILTEWFFAKDRNIRFLPIIILPSVFAAFGYLLLNSYIYGDPFAFRYILANNWQKHLMSPFISIMQSWKIAISGGLTSYGIMVGWMEAVTITICWLLIPVVFKKLRKSWAVFYILSVVLFSSTSFILSTPRYILSIPPFFVLIALAEKNYFFKILWGFVSIAFLLIFATVFSTGRWAF